jgi:small subunit ribosomal protein S9
MVVINPWTWGLGRRKKAIARVRLKAGAGGFVVNGKPMEEFFSTVAARRSAAAALEATENLLTYDVFCNVNGGGVSGQADAVSLGIARALKTLNPGYDETFRGTGLLTRDARSKERKKYGRRGACRGFQFSKR